MKPFRVINRESPAFFSLILAFFDFLGLHSIGEQRIAVSIATGVGVLLLGLVALRKLRGSGVPR